MPRDRPASPPRLIRSELLRISRFSAVGATASSVHVGVVWAVIDGLNIRPLIANAIAFSLALGISFVGHYYWTFCENLNWQRALWRFLVTALIGFFLNNIALVAALRFSPMSSAMSAVASACVVPITTYLLNRSWVFRVQ